MLPWRDMIEVPANYFGKGENYILPDEGEEQADFARRFDEYVVAHPEDPAGEQALRLYEENLASAKSIKQAVNEGIESFKPTPKSALAPILSPVVSSSFVVPRPMQPKRDIEKELKEQHILPLVTEVQPSTKEEDDEWTQIKLRIPVKYHKLLTDYATFKRRRPRDIVMKWIMQNCHLE